MKPTLKTILYATDMSDQARRAYEYSLDLAEHYKADITVLYVVENLSHMSNMLVGEILGKDKWEALRTDHRQRVITQLENNLAVFCTETESGFDTCRLTQGNINVKVGNATDQILETAGALRADLIVLGSHGWNQSGQNQIGSTARQVVRRSRIPVFLVK